MTTRRGLLGFLGLGAALPLLPRAAFAAPAQEMLASGVIPQQLVGDGSGYTYLWTMGDKVISTKPVLEHIPMSVPGEGVATCTITDNRGFTTQTAVEVDFTIDEPEAEEDWHLCT